MVKLQIAGIDRELKDVSTSWIHQQIRDRQRDGLSVCVKVVIEAQGVNIVLASGECGSSGGGQRQTTPEENRLFDLWEKLHLEEVPIHSGRLVAFLNQVKDLA